MRKILTDDIVKQYCLNELGFRNAASNKSIFHGYSKLASNNYAMTAPSQNSVEFYTSISQSPLINSVDLIQNLKRSDVNVFVPGKYTRADNLQRFADLSESDNEETPIQNLVTPESPFEEEEEFLKSLEKQTPVNQAESAPSNRILVNPMLRQALFNSAQKNTSPLPSPASLNDDDDDISDVQYLGVDVSPLATRAQRARRGNQL